MVGILVFMRVKWQNVLFIYFASTYSLYTESLINLIIFWMVPLSLESAFRKSVFRPVLNFCS